MTAKLYKLLGFIVLGIQMGCVAGAPVTPPPTPTPLMQTLVANSGTSDSNPHNAPTIRNHGPNDYNAPSNLNTSSPNRHAQTRDRYGLLRGLRLHDHPGCRRGLRYGEWGCY